MISGAIGLVAGVFIQKFIPSIGDVIVSKTQAAYAWAKSKVTTPAAPK